MSFIIQPSTGGGGGVAIPAGEVPYGTGPSVTSEPAFAYNPATDTLSAVNLAATAGTFSGAVQAGTLTSLGSVTGVAGVFSGAVSGTTGTFSGVVTGTVGFVGLGLTGNALAMTVTPAAPTSVQDPGILSLLGQDATGATRVGGQVNLVGGAGNTTGNGGAAFISGGSSPSGNGGAVTVQGGDGSSQFGGGATLRGGQGGAFGGNATVQAGTGPTNAFNGSVFLMTGSGVARLQINQTGLAFFNQTPIARPTTGVAAATFVANAGTGVNDTSTFNGYTIAQVVRALQLLGLLT